MGQGLARAEAATSAAASCLRRRRRPIRGLSSHVHAALRRMRPVLGAGPPALPACPDHEMNAGLRVWIWRPRQIVPRFRRTSGSRSGKRALPALREAGLACGRRVAASSRRVSLLGERNAAAQHILIIRNFLSSAASVCSCKPRLQHKGLARRLHQSPRSARSEHAHRRETRPQCSRRRAPPPGPSSASR